MRLIDIESESFLDEMREKQNACKGIIHNSDGEKTTWTERDHWEGVYGVFVEMALTLRKQPTVDAAPVKHGRWIMMDGMKPPEWHHHHQCSVCESYAPMKPPYGGREEFPPFCPACGARMGGVENEHGENMIRIIKPRGAGKTNSLLKLAKEHGCILVEPTQKHADCIRKMAERRGFQGVSVISFHQFLSDSQWSRAKYLIDELDSCLKFMGVCGYSNTELDNEGNEIIDERSQPLIGAIEPPKEKETW